MKLRNTLGITVLLAAAGATGLSQAQPAKKVITIAAFPSLDESVKIALKGFQQLRPDIEVKINSLQFADHHNALTTALATGQGLPDVAAVEIGYVGRFAEGGGLEDLNQPPYNAGQYKQLFVPYTIAQATSPDGRFVAMPTDIGPGTMYYRKDVLDRTKVNPNELRTWEGLIAAGKKIRAADKNAYLINSAASVANVIMRTGLRSGEGLYFDKAGKVLVGPDTPRFLKAFTMAKAVRDAGLDAKIGEWSNEWYDAFKKGTVAVQFSGAWLQGHLQNWMAPDTKGLWRIQDLPDGGFASWGGSFYAIPKGAKNKAEAWELIKYLTLNPKVQIDVFKGTGAFPALTSALSDPAFNQPVEFLGGQRARVTWKAAASKTPAIDVNKLDSVAETIVATALTQVLDEGKDPKAALADARAQIERRAAR